MQNLNNFLTPSEQKIIFFILLTFILGFSANFLVEKRNNEEIELIKSDSVKIYDLNKVDKNELVFIPFIGEVLAQNIIDYRGSNTFYTVEQLKEVQGIGAKRFDQIKDYFFVKDTDNFIPNNGKKIIDKNTNQGNLLNINKASLSDLIKVDNVGKRRAEDILLYIEREGGIESIDQLMEIQGVGSKTVYNLKKHFFAGDLNGR